MKKMIKGTVIKDIPDNLIADYEKLGWEEFKEEPKNVSHETSKEIPSKPSFKPIKK